MLVVLRDNLQDSLQFDGGVIVEVQRVTLPQSVIMDSMVDGVS